MVGAEMEKVYPVGASYFIPIEINKYFKREFLSTLQFFTIFSQQTFSILHNTFPRYPLFRCLFQKLKMTFIVIYFGGYSHEEMKKQLLN